MDALIKATALVLVVAAVLAPFALDDSEAEAEMDGVMLYQVNPFDCEGVSIHNYGTSTVDISDYTALVRAGHEARTRRDARHRHGGLGGRALLPAGQHRRHRRGEGGILRQVRTVQLRRRRLSDGREPRRGRHVLRQRRHRQHVLGRPRRDREGPLVLPRRQRRPRRQVRLVPVH